MATHTIPVGNHTQETQNLRMNNVSGIPRPVFGSTAYRRDKSPVFYTPTNNIVVPHNSLNPTGAVSNDRSPSDMMEELVDEMNNVTIQHGKKPLCMFRVSASTSNDELRPEDSASHVSEQLSHIWGWSDVANQRLPSLQSSLSQEYDLMQHSTTLIEEQDIQIDDINNQVYHTRHPELNLPINDIQDAEIIKLRSKFPEPFSRDDPNPLRHPREQQPIRFNMKLPSGSGNNPDHTPGSPPGGGPLSNGDGSGGEPHDNQFDSHQSNNNHSRNPGDPDGDSSPSKPDNEGPSPSNSENERDPHGDPPERACFTSLEPTLTQRREWTYDPTP
ncbi:hypothetical protein L218DRAFT_1001182 [Marasmius fiardii PR-910]|nr:hypothetical protein L218DRAFT_1001182 [Marasmius fiardii PR-910]